MSHKLPLILASTSPRRADLLAQAGVDFRVLAVSIDETWQSGERPLDYIERMVRTKAQAALMQPTVDNCVVLTADTIGVLGEQVLTKPVDKADALAMWAQLSDNTHRIYTAVQISKVIGGKVVDSGLICECTEVDFVPLTMSMQEAYWQTGEPTDKAGAYAIQGGAAAWVRAIRGSYTNVVGLPLAQTIALLDRLQLP